MYQVFYQEGSIIILNDDTERTRILSPSEEKKLFNLNGLLERLKENKTKRVMVDCIHGIKNLP